MSANEAIIDKYVLLVSEEDFAAYAGWLKEYAKTYQVDIHAWVLMRM